MKVRVIWFTSWFRTGNVLASLLSKINFIFGRRGRVAIRKKEYYILMKLWKRFITLMTKVFHLSMPKTQGFLVAFWFYKWSNPCYSSNLIFISPVEIMDDFWDFGLCITLYYNLSEINSLIYILVLWKVT